MTLSKMLPDEPHVEGLYEFLCSPMNRTNLIEDVDRVLKYYPIIGEVLANAELIVSNAKHELSQHRDVFGEELAKQGKASDAEITRRVVRYEPYCGVLGTINKWEAITTKFKRFAIALEMRKNSIDALLNYQRVEMKLLSERG
jgi:hypothetical protein